MPLTQRNLGTGLWNVNSCVLVIAEVLTEKVLGHRVHTSRIRRDTKVQDIWRCCTRWTRTSIHSERESHLRCMYR